jgi:hypothetical protein
MDSLAPKKANDKTEHYKERLAHANAELDAQRLQRMHLTDYLECAQKQQHREFNHAAGFTVPPGNGKYAGRLEMLAALRQALAGNFGPLSLFMEHPQIVKQVQEARRLKEEFMS